MRPWKPKMVESLKEMLDSHSTVAVLDFTGVPSSLLQRIKRDLRGRATIRMSKKTLMERALKSSEKFSPLAEDLVGQSAFLFTDENPFKIYSVIEDFTMMAPAKPGQVAPHDIVVPAGGTGLPPGPEIGKLQQAGLPARIKKGQIVIHEETALVKKGEEVNEAQAAALTQLDIRPMEVKLRLVAAMEEGIKFTPDVLHVDKAELFQSFASAASWAFNLAVETAWLTEGTVVPLLQKAARESKALAEESGFLTADNVGDMLVKAEAGAKALNDKMKR